MRRIASLLYSLGAGTTALSGDLTLTVGTVTGIGGSPMFQLRDPNGSDRNVLLPLLVGTESESTGLWYFIRNTGSANNLVVKDSTGVTTYATLGPGQWVWMLSSGTTATWQVVASTAEIGIATGSMFRSTEQTANGSPQNIAHGLGRTPTQVWWSVSDSGATGIYTLVPGSPDGTNVVMNGTAGVKYYVWAI